jgi:hypothetical protein
VFGDSEELLGATRGWEGDGVLSSIFRNFSLGYKPELVRTIDLIRENIENPGPGGLKMPLMRHILIGTEYKAGLLGLGHFWPDATHIFPMSLIDLPDTVWASNDLWKFARRLR